MTPIRTGPDGFTLEVQDGWQQGRGAYGGVSVGALLRAVEEVVGDARRAPRSLTAELTGPLDVGTADVKVRVLRAGKAVTTAAAWIEQRGEIVAHAVVVLGAARALDPPVPAVAYELSPPAQLAAGWDTTPALPFASPPWPRFAGHFEIRLVEGLVCSGGSRAETIGWVRPREAPSRVDAAYVAALADAFWPSAAVPMESLRPFATIAFTLGLLADPEELDPRVPLLHRGRSNAMAGGYVNEDRELWTPDGRLVAVNRQTIVIIK